MKSDAQLLADIQAELDWDPGVDNRGIIAAVSSGVVTLAGHVGSLLDKLHAERAVKRVAGVRVLANEIDIRLAPEMQHPDKEIAHAAAQALQLNTAVPANDIQATVTDGWITLEGNVDYFYQKEAAEQAVHGVRGVKGVKNSICVEPHSTAHQVHENIVRALHRHAILGVAPINVSIAEDVVTLSGEVDTWHERDAAEKVACSAPGIRRVENHLNIRGSRR